MEVRHKKTCYDVSGVICYFDYSKKCYVDHQGRDFYFDQHGHRIHFDGVVEKNKKYNYDHDGKKFFWDHKCQPKFVIVKKKVECDSLSDEELCTVDDCKKDKDNCGCKKDKDNCGCKKQCGCKRKPEVLCGIVDNEPIFANPFNYGFLGNVGFQSGCGSCASNFGCNSCNRGWDQGNFGWGQQPF